MVSDEFTVPFCAIHHQQNDATGNQRQWWQEHKIDPLPVRISQIITGKRSITADTALRLGRYFGSSADLWMNLQKIYDLDLAAKALGKAINKMPQRPVEPTATRA